MEDERELPLGQAASESVDESESDVVLPIRLSGLDDRDARYVNLLNVNFDRASFQIVFSQFLQPVVTSPHDARQLAAQGYVPAKVVARLIFTPLMMEETINLLQAQLDRFHQQRDEPTAGEVGVSDE